MEVGKALGGWIFVFGGTDEENTMERVHLLKKLYTQFNSCVPLIALPVSFLPLFQNPILRISQLPNGNS